MVSLSLNYSRPATANTHTPSNSSTSSSDYSTAASSLGPEDQNHNSAAGDGGAAIRRTTSGGPKALLSHSRPSSSDRANTLLRPSSSPTKSRSHSQTPSLSRRIVVASAPLTPMTPAVLLQTHQSVSQPPLSRLGSTAAIGLKALLPSSLKPVSPAMGASTPLPNQSQASRGLQPVHSLEESYVGKVSARLAESVNKVFLPSSGAALQADLVWNGRYAPKWTKAHEVGEMVVLELHASLHDAYLLRTLLRSSVLKSLSLFLTRLTALLIPGATTNSSASSLKDFDTLPVPLRYNFAIVRCAYELKQGLIKASVGAPSFVGETMKGWIDKLDELVGRIMNPLLANTRSEVGVICAKARFVNSPERSSSVDKVASSIALPVPAGLRSLALARTSSTAAVPVTVQPGWLKELAVVLDGQANLVKRLECGKDGDKWLVTVGVCSVWKTILAMSARGIGADEVAKASAPVAVTKGLFKSNKKESSPPGSPPHQAADAHSLHPYADIASAKLLTELEQFETRLNSYISTLSSAPAHHILSSGVCPSLACALCATGRTFDAESSDDDSEDEEGGCGLAQCAMREALQALSAMIVVIKACEHDGDLEAAMLYAAGAEGKAKSEADLLPLTPFALLDAVPAPVVAAPILTVDPCPTLAHALDTIPVLILLHLLASRLPPTLRFQLPHQVWGLTYAAYEKELRGFAAAEEWTPEVGWEMAGEVGDVLGRKGKTWEGEGRERLAVLAVAIRTKVGVEVVDV